MADALRNIKYAKEMIGVKTTAQLEKLGTGAMPGKAWRAFGYPLSSPGDPCWYTVVASYYTSAPNRHFSARKYNLTPTAALRILPAAPHVDIDISL